MAHLIELHDVVLRDPVAEEGAVDQEHDADADESMSRAAGRVAQARHRLGPHRVDQLRVTHPRNERVVISLHAVSLRAAAGGNCADISLGLTPPCSARPPERAPPNHAMTLPRISGSARPVQLKLSAKGSHVLDGIPGAGGKWQDPAVATSRSRDTPIRAGTRVR